VRQLGSVEGDERAATVSSARFNCAGIFRPRFSARLKMPAQAFGLKKYRGGTCPASKTSHNEHATTLLGDSEAASVKSSPRIPIPEEVQAPDEGAKISSAVTRKDAGDVFPNEPPGAIAAKDFKIDEREISPRVTKARAKAGHAEGLARGSSDENIENCIGPAPEVQQVAEVRDLGIVMGEHGAWEGRDLGKEDGIEAERQPRHRRGFDPAADAGEPHEVSSDGARLSGRRLATLISAFAASSSVRS